MSAVSRISRLKKAQGLVWESILEAAPDRRAPLVAQWRALEVQIADLESRNVKKGDPVDEIAARRVARGGSTARARRA